MNPTENHRSLDEPHQPSVLRHLQSQQIGNSEEHATTTRFHQQIGDPEEHASSVFKYNSDEELATIRFRHQVMKSLGAIADEDAQQEIERARQQLKIGHDFDLSLNLNFSHLSVAA